MRVALFWAAWNTAIQAMANTTVLMSNVIRLPQSWVIASKHRSTAKKAGPETARLFLWGCRSAQNVAHLHWRSEEHTSELQSLMRISYAVFCLKKKKNKTLNIIIQAPTRI